MKFYGITMEGKFINQTVEASVTESFVFSRDTGRLVYNLEDGYLWWGDGIEGKWRTVGDLGGGGDANEIEDMYSDLLRTSIFLNGTWDEFGEKPADDVYINDTNTDMSHDGDLKIYTYESGMILETNNLFDSVALDGVVSQILACMPSVWYFISDGADPVVYVTADGGTHWEQARNNDYHKFEWPGTDLRMRIVIPSGTNTGFIRSLGLIYNKDLSTSCSRYALTDIEIIIDDPPSNTIIVDYIPGNVLVFLNGTLLKDGDDYTAEDGTAIYINSPDLQVGDVIHIISFGTSIGGGGDTDLSPYIRKDGTITYEANQPMGNNKITGMADGVDPQDAVTVAQLSSNLNKHYRLYNSLFDTVMVHTGTNGQVDVRGNRVVDVGAATAGTDAVNVDYANSHYAPISHVTQSATSSTLGHVKVWVTTGGILRIQTV